MRISKITVRNYPRPTGNRQLGVCAGGFTLVELLAVVLVIALLTGLAMSTASYVMKRAASQSTRAQITAIVNALENYKSDWGVYPQTCPCRISAIGFCESTNNWILYRALSGVSTGKRYLNLQGFRIRTFSQSASNIFTGAISPSGGLTNICDQWGIPFNYYCAPTNLYSIVNAGGAYAGYTIGGQVNVASYDLFSYGADHFTFVPAALIAAWGPVVSSGWTTTNSANDDITNWDK